MAITQNNQPPRKGGSYIKKTKDGPAELVQRTGPAKGMKDAKAADKASGPTAPAAKKKGE